MRLNTSKASSLRFIAKRNLGDSGSIENRIALHKFTSDVDIKNNRHGFISTMKIFMLQSIGMSRRASGDIRTHTHDKAMVTNDTALAAVELV